MSNYRKYVILTVEPLSNQNNTFRLGLMKEDFNQIKSHILKINMVNIIFNLNENNVVNIIEALTTYKRYGKLVNPLINDWIRLNNFHLFIRNKPTKLIFELKITEKEHIFKFYKNI